MVSNHMVLTKKWRGSKIGILRLAIALKGITPIATCPNLNRLSLYGLSSLFLVYYFGFRELKIYNVTLIEVPFSHGG